MTWKKTLMALYLKILPSDYPDLLLEISRYWHPVEAFLSDFIVVVFLRYD